MDYPNCIDDDKNMQQWYIGGGGGWNQPVYVFNDAS